jgi:hypothetical protein
MTNFSIPNSAPATGRISTPSSARSKRANNHSVSLSVIRRWMLDVEPSTFSFLSAIRDPQSAIGRVKGAWWPSRSSKPSSPRKWRGRFDSYPLRRFIFDFAVAAAVSAATIKLQTSNIGEGGDSMSREQIRKLTSLSSCAG